MQIRKVIFILNMRKSALFILVVLQVILFWTNQDSVLSYLRPNHTPAENGKSIWIFIYTELVIFLMLGGD